MNPSANTAPRAAAEDLTDVDGAVRAVTLALRRVNAAIAAETTDSRTVADAIAMLQNAITVQGATARQVIRRMETAGV
jgi:hypothetical protein